MSGKMVSTGVSGICSAGIAVLLIGDEYNGSKRWLSLGPFSFNRRNLQSCGYIVFDAIDYAKCKSMGKFTTVL